MGTTAEKLQNILTAKADIGAAIVEKGGSVPVKFIDYGKAIRALPAGGGPSAADELWGTPADPEKVYAATRPAHWMPMPEPAPLEIYFLFEIPAGGSAAIALKSNTADEAYEVSVGHVTDGAYVPKNTFTLATGVTWEAELAAADYPEFSVGDSTVQVMIRMKFTSSAKMCQVVKHPNNPDRDCNILEVNGDMGSKGYLAQMGSTTSAGKLTKLRYFKMKNQNSATTGNPILTVGSYFAYCTGLICVMDLGQPTNSPLMGTFRGCSSLIAYPIETFYVSDDATTVNKNNSGSRLFEGCKSMTGVSPRTFKNMVNKSQMLMGCEALTRLIGIDISNSSNISKITAGCLGLISVENIVVGNSRVTSHGEPIFKGLPSLRRLTFAPMATAWTRAFDLNISSCAFNRAGLVECFSSLPTLAAGNTASIIVYGNPGTADLTAADIAIATAKGWTVVTEALAETTAEEGS